MEKDSKQILLNCGQMESRFALIHNGKLEEYQIERKNDGPKVGDIYLGRIVNLDPLLQAAFVDIGAQKNAFLHFHEMLPGYADLAEKYLQDQAKQQAAQEQEINAAKDVEKLELLCRWEYTVVQLL